MKSVDEAEFEWGWAVSTPTRKRVAGPTDERLSVPTREGDVVAEPGDYILMEEDGNCYPIDPEKFEEYYERER